MASAIAGGNRRRWASVKTWAKDWGPILTLLGMIASAIFAVSAAGARASVVDKPSKADVEKRIEQAEAKAAAGDVAATALDNERHRALETRLEGIEGSVRELKDDMHGEVDRIIRAVEAGRGKR